MNKKGLSDIITSVLIILLVLIAVGLLWFFLRPFIFNTSEELEGAGSCFQTSVEPTKCVYTRGNDQKRHLFISIKREGTAKGNITGVNLIFTTENGELRTFKDTNLLNNITMPQQFETRKPIVEVSKTVDFIPRSLKISISLSSKKDVCPPFSQEIACTEYVFTGRSADIAGDPQEPPLPPLPPAPDCYLGNFDRFTFTNLWLAYCGSDLDCKSPNIQQTYNNIDERNYDADDLLYIIDFNQDLVVTQDDYRDFWASNDYQSGGKTEESYVC